jgi:hypothetical protein
MYELIPIFGGVAVGLVAARLAPKASVRLILGAGLAIGPLATVLSGEFEESWAFLLWDTAQAIVAAALTLALARRFAARRAREPD